MEFSCSTQGRDFHLATFIWVSTPSLDLTCLLGVTHQHKSVRQVIANKDNHLTSPVTSCLTSPVTSCLTKGWHIPSSSLTNGSHSLPTLEVGLQGRRPGESREAHHGLPILFALLVALGVIDGDGQDMCLLFLFSKLQDLQHLDRTSWRICITRALSPCHLCCLVGPYLQL